MTHFVGLVIGPNIEGQLAPYDEQLAVDAYEVKIDTEGAWITSLLDGTGVDPTDKVAVAKHLAEESDYPGVHIDRDGDVAEWSTYNPDSKWDWYVIGGRWDYELMLRDGTTANVARADQIDWTATFFQWGGTPGVVVADGTWTARSRYGWFGSSLDLIDPDFWDNWLRDYVTRLGTQTVTLIDFHV